MLLFHSYGPSRSWMWVFDLPIHTGVVILHHTTSCIVITRCTDVTHIPLHVSLELFIHTHTWAWIPFIHHFDPVQSSINGTFLVVFYYCRNISSYVNNAYFDANMIFPYVFANDIHSMTSIILTCILSNTTYTKQIICVDFHK